MIAIMTKTFGRNQRSQGAGVGGSDGSGRRRLRLPSMLSMAVMSGVLSAASCGGNATSARDGSPADTNRVEMASDVTPPSDKPPASESPVMADAPDAPDASDTPAGPDTPPGPDSPVMADASDARDAGADRFNPFDSDPPPSDLLI